MTIYQVRERARSYGHSIGILTLDDAVPAIPGSVANASTYEYPVLFRPVPGLTFKRVFQRDPACADLLVRAACELEEQGVKGITGNCGFMLPFQRLVANSVTVPVFLSSLMQLPFIAASIGHGQRIGIIVGGDERNLSDEILTMAGCGNKDLVRVQGMKDRPAVKSFLQDLSGSLNADQVRDEIVDTVRQMKIQNPDVTAILIECSELPPYAAAVQRAIDLPTYDFLTMIDYFHHATCREDFIGSY